MCASARRRRPLPIQIDAIEPHRRDSRVEPRVRVTEDRRHRLDVRCAVGEVVRVLEPGAVRRRLRLRLVHFNTAGQQLVVLTFLMMRIRTHPDDCEHRRYSKGCDGLMAMDASTEGILSGTDARQLSRRLGVRIRKATRQVAPSMMGKSVHLCSCSSRACSRTPCAAACLEWQASAAEVSWCTYLAHQIALNLRCRSATHARHHPFAFRHVCSFVGLVALLCTAAEGACLADARSLIRKLRTHCIFRYNL